MYVLQLFYNFVDIDIGRAFGIGVLDYLCLIYMRQNVCLSALSVWANFCGL